MRRLIFLLCLASSILSFGQSSEKLPKKHLGSYEGVVPGYIVGFGKETTEVGETPIEIILTTDEVSIKIGRRNLKGT